ncbi:DUF2188 domain-containing protein [Carnobacterium maltaromaticum]|uniref:DUF2188 domain-containing protein n=1 Tax=Carnobacterium maltaromaticum TaxID=2751 RepID=UPI00298A1221|nr:DUF2188 domain-containing protein [Carnobacterium maltaromaticum]MDW5524611.1 DUF2188 domain-containing protein [Carnobacterium maltaromaticum]
MKHGQWMLNKEYGERWEASEYFDTKEEAIEYGVTLLNKYNSLDADGKSDMDLSDGLNMRPDDCENIYTFYVGQIETVGFPDVVDNLLETISETVYDEVGEVADGYLNDVTTEHKEELSDLIHDWAKRNGYLPNCYIMGATEEINITSSVEGEE